MPQDSAKTYLYAEVGIDTAEMTDEEMLATVQKYRMSQYEKLSDEVYREKGYDSNGIPTDKTLIRLGFDQEEYFNIVRSARARATQ